VELDEWKWGIPALEDCVKQLTDVLEPVVIDEPFLLPSSRIEGLAPDITSFPKENLVSAMIEMAAAAAIESYEIIRYFSSIMAPTDEMRPRLLLFQSLPYRSAAMERRLQLRLKLKKTNKASEFMPSRVFSDTTETNLNPDIWKSI